MRSFQDTCEYLRLNPKTWLITGVSGFIGSNLLEFLLNLDQHVIGIDNFATGSKMNINNVEQGVNAKQFRRFKFIECDIRDFNTMSNYYKGVDFVLHQAALGSVPRSLKDPIATNETNISGFVNVIKASMDAGVQSFTYAASSSTYGDHKALPKHEDIIGKPLFDSATIHLENQNTFSIKSYDLSTSNRYIASVKLNGVLLDRSFLYHSEIINGGELEFFMTDKPSDWGTEKGAEPITSIDDYLIVPAPFIFEGNVAFKTKTSIRLGNADPKATIYFKIDDSTYQPYKQPIEITEAGTLYVYAEKNKFKSAVISTEFFKIDPTINIKLETNFANQYNAGGNEALIDGILGTADFRTGTWQGYFNEDLVAIVDLGRQKSINLVSINFLRDQRSWIFYPSKVVCYGSKDGIDFQPIDTIELEPPSPSDEIEFKTIEFKTNKNQYQYIKLIAKTYGTLPSWHLGFPHDGKSWLFADEISIN